MICLGHAGDDNYTGILKLLAVLLSSEKEAEEKKKDYPSTLQRICQIITDVYNDNRFLLQGESISAELDEQMVYSQLDDDEQTVWSLLLASGYLKVKHFHAYISAIGEWKQEYEAVLTAQGIPREKIRKYGFAFRGKEVLIGESA